MKVLGIDTASVIASVALIDEGKLVREELSPITDQSRLRAGTVHRANHAETLLPLIDTVLKRTGLSLPEISAVAVSIGPGSFTGLRIGLSTVKGLAYGWGIPVVGVPTLLAVAARVTDWQGLVCPFLDAKKREVYSALFQKKGESLERLSGDLVSSPETVIRRVVPLSDGTPVMFIGDGIRVYGELIETSLGSRCVLTSGETYPSTASAVARLGEERIRKEEIDPLGALVPLYIRQSEAELKKRSERI